MEQINLGTEKIGKLLRKFAIPCIISMVVNALYNMVDQIFIGWGVGYLGNGATNVVFPITVLAMGFAFMLSDGGAAYLSLKLGQKKKDEASKGVATTIIIAATISLIMLIGGLVFLEPLLKLFGCTDGLRPYAISYGRIIILGLPFFILGSVLNGLIRADGAPKYAMFSMVLGAVLNIVLDPIFIFPLQLGVAGAAYATIISQFVTFLLNAIYIKKFKTVEISRKLFKFEPKTGLKVIALGISSFITQISFVLLIAVQNNLLGKYGVESKFGQDIPITVFGIVMKINQILNSIIIGIAVGSQPIVGFNYGAKQFDRVRKALYMTIGCGVTISTLGFLACQLFPEGIAAMFVDSAKGGDEGLMIAAASQAMRNIVIMFPLVGFQIVAAAFFQYIGHAKLAIFVSMTRQMLFLLPLLWIIPRFYGAMGVWVSMPIADCASITLATILLIRELKRLK